MQNGKNEMKIKILLKNYIRFNVDHQANTYIYDNFLCLQSHHQIQIDGMTSAN